MTLFLLAVILVQAFAILRQRQLMAEQRTRADEYMKVLRNYVVQTLNETKDPR